MAKLKKSTKTPAAKGNDAGAQATAGIEARKALAGQTNTSAKMPLLDEGKVRIRFLKRHVVDDHRRGTRDEESYVEGDIADLSEQSARHFTSRDIAVRMDG
ncbi:hypothetical protein O4H61_03325 [Roseovarius aestuarii]|nr:hypothetical protein [Roseovarius aestuarii]